jgi:hypothetical protein
MDVDREFILRKLSDLLHWDEARDSTEFPWLRLMARFKFDGYQDYLAGARFLESLVDWLQQFDEPDRQVAYDFVRNRLVYVGPAEMQHLVELFYPEHVRPHLATTVARARETPPYRVWADAAATQAYFKLLRKTLFIELSDGARIDIFRRANAGIVSNEQIYTAPRINDDKWKDMRKELRKDLNDNSALFSVVYLVDDFTGSGTSLIRFTDGGWKGKLVRFWEEIRPHLGDYFEEPWCVCVHHYMATQQAVKAVVEREEKIRAALGPGNWFPSVHFSYSTTLPPELPLVDDKADPFLRLVENYYNRDVEVKRHNLEGGGESVQFGYAECRLPLILDHNTPNNSFALLWAESTSGKGRQMRPLFRRRQRHT